MHNLESFMVRCRNQLVCLTLLMASFSVVAQELDASMRQYTKFEAALENQLKTIHDSEQYAATVKSLAQEYAPHSLREQAYLNYLACVNNIELRSVRDSDKATLLERNNFAVAESLCEQNRFNNAGESGKAYDRVLVAYSMQSEVSSAPLRYLSAYLYTSESIKKARFAEGIEATRIMLAIAKESHFQHLQSQAYSLRALLQNDLKEFDRALQNIDRAIELAETTYARSNRLLDKGYILSYAGRNEEAIALYEDLLQLESSQGDYELKLIVWSNLHYIYMNTGQVEKNLALTQDMLNLAEAKASPYYVAAAKMSRAYALLDTGQYDRASKLFNEADQWYLANGYDLRTAEGYEDWARLLQEQSYSKEAYSYLKKSIELYRELESNDGHSESDTIAALLEAEQKQQALAQAEQSIAFMEARQRAQIQLIAAIVAGALLTLTIGLFAHFRLKRLNRALDSANAALEHENHHDPLTGAHNRRYFYRFLEDEKLRDDRDKAFIGLIDIDHFKTLNDTYGHDVGDEVLQILVKRLKHATKSDDKVIRWGGEEFLIYLAVNDSIDSTRLALQRIIAEVNSQPFSAGQHVLAVTISMGFKVVELSSDIHHEVKQVDNYLYQAKREGRQRAIGQFNEELALEQI
ncbi:diguanylate cyclase (GGDEF)-like protein [Idiomarina fontislapidosi]|uniref:diguanylate cyclase n=2 Tax=Idiomarina fontislapidosi TaxID=263723 RepID=A0A432Y9U6_9GAMM|nr:diguanylate cyclase (GGDEF)-like protein [Idiomarina fontislapidosi]RUO57738.1 hypothetical protein CWE25_04525 [Idiomarina fontislapidosi]